MSTLLVNTEGRSKFLDTTDLVDSGTSLGSTIKSNEFLSELSLGLTNVDKKPLLVPTTGIIDVARNFSWYAGPAMGSTEYPKGSGKMVHAIDKIPTVFLTEREQLLSSLISGALYYLNASGRTVDKFVNSGVVESLLGKIGSSAAKTAATTVQKSITDLTGTLNGIAGGTGSDAALLQSHNLKSLQGIYFTKPTGFNYRLPMYGSPSTPTAGYGDASTAGTLGVAAIDAIQTGVDNIASVVNFAQPGTYIEKPKYFAGVNGRQETVTFPLVNTVKRTNHSPIQQNYELLWLLAFQNRAYKTSFSRTPPPKIYSVTLPGQFSMPYAFISNMSVNFIGTTRNTKVYVPSGSGEGNITSKLISTPVPDAYQVSLTFTSLIGDYGNTMLSDAYGTSINGNTVTVGNKNS